MEERQDKTDRQTDREQINKVKYRSESLKNEFSIVWHRRTGMPSCRNGRRPKAKMK